MQEAERTLSPLQLARALGVGESTVKRWIDRGRISAERTPGGHRRIPFPVALHFARSFRRDLEDPGALGLALAEEPTPEAFVRLLERGNPEAAVALFERLYASGLPAAALADRWIAPAMQQIGHGWEEGALAVTTEHRASSLVVRGLHALLRARPRLPREAEALPLAQVAALSGDPYVLPGLCAELVLGEAGYRVSNFGTDTPVDALARAVRADRPALLAISLSVASAPALTALQRSELRSACREADAALVLGGRAVTPEVVDAFGATAWCRSMAELAEVAHRLGGGGPPLPAAAS